MAAIAKPSKLDHAVSKWQRQTVRQKEKRAREGQAERKWRALSALVKLREKGICQLTGMPTLTTGDPRLIGAAHHIVYRSAGGKDILSNLLWVTGHVHALEHAHQIDIRGTATHFTVSCDDPKAVAEVTMQFDSPLSKAFWKKA